MATVLDQRAVPRRTPVPPRPAPGWLIGVGLLLLALVPRLIGLTADLPVLHHPDEPANLRIVDAMVTSGDPNPHFFNYPSLFFYLHAALHLDGPLLGWLPGLGELPPVTQVMGVSYAPTSGSVLLHRGLTVGLGVLVVLVGWATTRRLGPGLLPAAVTAVLLALSPTLVTHSRLVTPDMLAGLLVAVAVLVSVWLLQSGCWPAYLVAGLAVGLAVSAKYTAVVAAVPVLLAALLSGRVRRAVLGLPLAGSCALGAFLVTTPYALLDRRAFGQGLRFERAHYATGHDGMEGDSLAFYATHLATRETVLVALALAGLIAVGTGARQHWRAAVVVASFPVVYGAVVAMQAVRNDRTILLLLPPLAVLAGLAVPPLLRWAGGRRRPACGLVAAAVLATALLAVQVAGTFPRPGPSTWTAASRWLDAHAKPGAGLLIESYAPWPDPARYRVMTRVRLIDGAALPPGVDYVVASETMYGRYTGAPARYPAAAAAYQRLFGDLREVASFAEGTGPRIRVFQVSG
ncbi:MAG TPA: glycosyltransferase family 39 protein [Pseudonocardiaceae bacterium]|nr:glycosyltransferase family 39 protein [Pseudonocardiaceae bacterium]